jgi:RHH-type proline utilization regulon transcriptional repressor/proline dehydrogenase/delta 1-pyrroline-5-carboxylate dehydrogenase
MSNEVVLLQGKKYSDPLRTAIIDLYHADEAAVVDSMLSYLSFWDDSLITSVQERAYKLVAEVRVSKNKIGGISAFMHHYDLSSEEGILLMCLAEALLRIPDKNTEYKLIKDKLTAADWSKHKGSSDSNFVNVATLGLIFTGKVLGDSNQSNFLQHAWKKLVTRSGEPVIRLAVRDAMRVLSEQFVLGQNITEAIKRSKDFVKLGYSYSYDMLGEVARTEEDAKRYLDSYVNALNVIGAKNEIKNLYLAPSISVKLSALYTRYEFSCQEEAVAVLTERLRGLVELAYKYNISLTVDAEECARLDISLDIIEKILVDNAFAGWDGFGLAVQAYQKRAHRVIRYLMATARKANKKLQIRLVKGAYWDSEIKHAQEQGDHDYPVFTRKTATDANYIACAKLMLENLDVLYPQFATHNAHAVAAILALTKDIAKDKFEFQNLQGMGKALHDLLVLEGYRSRIYAPVGTHEDLLPYLVRRLLENGANSSFVNRIFDASYAIDDLVADPIVKLRNYRHKFNPALPRPRYIFANNRLNARGIDITDWNALEILINNLQFAANKEWLAGDYKNNALSQEVISPTDHTVVGKVVLTTKEEANKIFMLATHALPTWQRSAVEDRAQVLNKVADLLEYHIADLIYLIVREAGRTVTDAVDDVREAIDFCRYYALEGVRLFAPQKLQGVTGEINTLSYLGRGVMICISPWNFPAAIFTGQIAAALMAGNAVIAKSAEQTPLTAAYITKLFYAAGLPENILTSVYGDGELGEFLVSALAHSGVLFTGSNNAAWAINKAILKPGKPIVPFIAETGGMNCMLADSSALQESLVSDAIKSSFGSAGQRCSALRILFVQEDILDSTLRMLSGAMQLLHVGDPMLLRTDIGPVIDKNAKDKIDAHIARMKAEAKLIAVTPIDPSLSGTFVAPHAFLLQDLSMLQEEIFGPVLHVISYKAKDLDHVITQINSLGFGLTFGMHTRISSSADYVASKINVGNMYLNRTMIGAVVGVQPFGGCGLSGTGPKAGGPNYLLRLAQEVSISYDITASGGNAALMSLQDVD